MPKKEVLEKLITKTKVYLLIIAILLIVICFYNKKLIIFSIMLYILIIIYSIWANSKNKTEVIKHLQEATLDINSIVKNALINSPLPIIIMKNTGEIMWKSSKFVEEFMNLPIKNYLSSLFKEIKNEYENSNITKFIKEIEIDKKNYNIKGEIIKNKFSRKNEDFYIVLYVMENTEYINLKNKYKNENICVGLITIDNYEELFQRISVEEKPKLIANIEKSIYNWTNSSGGLIIKNERETYVFIFYYSYLKILEENKFNILDDIKEIDVDNNIPVTLSISISAEGENIFEKYKLAMAGMEIILGRGGDQAVVKKNNQYKFYGGRTQEVEKRTKVKARIISQSLESLVKESDNVIIMGHKNADMDSMGSSLGLYRFVKKLEKEVYIVNTTYGSAIEDLINEIEKDSEYKSVFIDENEALSISNEKSLLIVVDTHKPTFTEVPKLFDKTQRIVVIDHHRKSTEFIKDPLLIFHEVYASSASELVVEILQYAEFDLGIKPIEVEALYAGIMTDTKNFTFKTGVRTFEAAAFLRKFGVDIIRVKKWFQSNLEEYNQIADIVKKAEIINKNIAIAINEKENANDTILICAKSADELLTISTIVASFVIGKIGEKVIISGRSIGDVNVQVILEKMEGGGHMTTAGAQISGKTIEEVKEILIEKIDEYFEEIG